MITIFMFDWRFRLAYFCNTRYRTFKLLRALRCPTAPLKVTSKVLLRVGSLVKNDVLHSPQLTRLC
jgi:hypothetical protein